MITWSNNGTVCLCAFEGTPCDVCRAEANSDAFAEFMEAWAIQNARIVRRLSADEISTGHQAALAASSGCNDGSF